MPDRASRAKGPALRGGGSGAGEGAPIDIYGGAAFDPTANVIALVESQAAAARDLRKSDNKFYDAQIHHLREIGKLRAEHAETLRTSDLDRLASTRQVDVLAGNASAAALATAVQTLANTSDRNAETLRNTLTATAATMAKQTADQAAVLSTQTDNLVKDINARIAELQKAQYQGVGKSSVADPIYEQLASQVKFLVENANQGQGKQAVTDPILAEMRADQKLLIAAMTSGTGEKSGKLSQQQFLFAIFAALIGLITLYLMLRGKV